MPHSGRLSRGHLKAAEATHPGFLSSPPLSAEHGRYRAGVRDDCLSRQSQHQKKGWCSPCPRSTI